MSFGEWLNANDVINETMRRDREEREAWFRMGFGCRTHGPGCRVPAGYDREHSDSDRPYTVDELAVRGSGPHFGAYGSSEEYMAGWNLWKALRRDARPSALELTVLQPMWDARLREKLDRIVDDAPAEWREGVRAGIRKGMPDLYGGND